MYLQKVTSRNIVFKKLVFCLKVNDENTNSRIRIQDSDPHQNVMDPEHCPGGLLAITDQVLVAVATSQILTCLILS
jgi:hypothetical protein